MLVQGYRKTRKINLPISLFRRLVGWEMDQIDSNLTTEIPKMKTVKLWEKQGTGLGTRG